MTEFSLVILGSKGTGKSKLVLQFTGENGGFYCGELDLTIEDSYRKQITIDEETCLLDIYDTTGEYSKSHQLQIKKAQGIICAYDVTSRKSFDLLNSFREQICSLKENQHKICVVLVGNKCDLDSERTVTYEEGKKFAELSGWLFYETSAKHRINVEEPFFDLIREIRKCDIGNKTNSKKGIGKFPFLKNKKV